MKNQKQTIVIVDEMHPLDDFSEKVLDYLELDYALFDISNASLLRTVFQYDPDEVVVVLNTALVATESQITSMKQEGYTTVFVSSLVDYYRQCQKFEDIFSISKEEDAAK